MFTKIESTFYVSLYLSGPIEVAKQILRQECKREGLCVTIYQTTYIYTGGEEIGYVVGLINYPRFPTTQEVLLERARWVLSLLLEGTHQSSALLVSPSITEWITNRDEA